MEKPESLPEETNSPNKALSPEEIVGKKPKVFYQEFSDSTGSAVAIDDAADACKEYHSQQSQADQKEIAELKRKVEELEEVLEDKRKITKEIDVIINGKNAAIQPALIDVQKSVELLVRNLAASEEKSAKLVEALRYVCSKLYILINTTNGLRPDIRIDAVKANDVANEALKYYEAK